MRNPEWVSLSDSERGQLVGIWLLAADHNGVIPASQETIQKLCYMDGLPNISKFIELGFIEDNGCHYDAKVTPERRQDDSPEENRIEENRREKSCPKFETTSDEFRLSQLLLNLIQKRKPKFKQPDIGKWAKHTALMIYRDKREPSEIEGVINWCQADEFWQNNILSTEKLREQFDQLSMKMDAEIKKGSAKDSGLCEHCGKGQKYLGGLCIDCHYRKDEEWFSYTIKTEGKQMPAEPELFDYYEATTFEPPL